MITTLFATSPWWGGTVVGTVFYLVTGIVF